MATPTKTPSDLPREVDQSRLSCMCGYDLVVVVRFAVVATRGVAQFPVVLPCPLQRRDRKLHTSGLQQQHGKTLEKREEATQQRPRQARERCKQACTGRKVCRQNKRDVRGRCDHRVEVAQVHKYIAIVRSTVSLVSRVPTGRDFLTTFRTKESTYSNMRHTIVTALSRRGLPGTVCFL